MRNKLSLLVNFVGVDKLSGSLRNIVALGKKGSDSINGLRGEGRKLESQLKKVRQEIAAGKGQLPGLVEEERRLARAIDDTNARLERRQRLNAIEADRRTMVARGEELRSRGKEHMMQGAAIAAPLILAAKSAAEFSSGMVDIQQKAELTDAATDALAGNIMAMAKAAKQMPEDVRSGLDLLLAMGMSVDDASAAMGPAGRLATAYKVDIPDAAGAAFASINNLKVASAETARIFDTMAEAGNQGGFEVSDMARHFPALTAQMQALGEEGIPAVADLSAALQVAMHTAAGADAAGNNIKNLLGQINAPRTITAFKKNFGVDLPAAMKKLTDEGYSSLEAIAMVTDQATKGDMQKLGFAFGNEQARMGLMGIMQNLDEYRRIRDAAMDSGGTVDAAFDQRVQRDATVQWTALKSSASQVAITLGSSLLPAANDAMNMIARLAGKVADWAERNPELASGIMKGAAALAAFKIGVGATMFALGGMMGPLASGIALWKKYKELGSVAAVFPKIATGIKLVGVALRFLALNPIGLAITAIVGGAMLIYKYWEPISTFFQRHWTTIRNVALGMMVIFTPWVAAILYVASLIYRNWDSIKETTLSMVATVSRIVSPFIAPFLTIQRFMQGLVGKFFRFGVNIIGGLIRGIASMTGNVIKAFLNLAGSIGARFAAALGIESPSRVFMEFGRHTAQGLALGIDRARSQPMSAISRLASGVTAAGAIALTPIAASASGGAAIGAGGGGIALTIHINQQPGENAEALADRVVRLIEQKTAITARRSYEDRD